MEHLLRLWARLSRCVHARTTTATVAAKATTPPAPVPTSATAPTIHPSHLRIRIQKAYDVNTLPQRLQGPQLPEQPLGNTTATTNASVRAGNP